MLSGAGLVISVAGIRELGWMIGPVMLALMLVVAVSPVQGWMLRRGLPRWLATIAVILILYAVLLTLVGILGVSVAQLAGLLPGYSDQAGQLLTAVQDQLGRWGVGSAQINDFVGQIDLGRVTDILTTVLSSLTSTASTLFFLLATLLFLGMDAVGFPERLARISGDRPAVVVALQSFARGTRRYLVVSSFFGAICSVLDVVALTWLTVPLPVLWGVLAFITNYIPNVGFFVGLVPPALLALLDGGWREMVAVIIAYMVINVLIQTVIQPKFVGDVVGLSVTVTFLATAFWAWALGPLGALLAIPLTLLVKALLIDVDPGSHWIDTLIGSGTGTVRAVPGVVAASGRAADADTDDARADAADAGPVDVHGVADLPRRVRPAEGATP